MERAVEEITQSTNDPLEQISQSVQDVTNLIHQAIPDTESPTITLDKTSRSDYAENLVVHHDRGGPISEQYRALRTNLLARCEEDRFCFLVTSAETGEGKTVTCLNLAFVMAERLDQRTIMVDFNLRDGQIASLLSAPSSPGVAEYLAGTAQMSEIIHPTVYPNLFFIPAGQFPTHQAGELLGRAELKKLVDQIRRDFEYVLLDTPAVNRFSDAGVAGLAAGEALLVVRLNKTRREAVDQAVRSLRNANIDLVGLLMTHQQNLFFN